MTTMNTEVGDRRAVAPPTVALEFALEFLTGLPASALSTGG